MFHLSDDERKAFTAVAQSRNGQFILTALEKRKADLVEAWVKNMDPNFGANMRGKVSEVMELLELLQSLSKSKE